MSGGIRFGVRRLQLLAVAAALGLVLCLNVATSFGASATPSPTGEKVVLRIGWLESPDNLNPFIGNFTTSYMVWTLNYEELVGNDPTTLAPAPGLATSWSVSPDQKTWTFKIRSDATWQDGVPVTARDVAFTFNYAVQNDLTNVATYTAGIVSARAIDDTTCEITTEAPKANMLRMAVPIVPEHIWSKISGKAAGSSYQNKPPIVGSGPFQVVEFKPAKFVHLVANPNYWGGAPKIDELVFQIYQNPESLVSDLKSGAIDGAFGVPGAQFAALAGQAGITTNKGASWTFNELGFNCYESPDSLGNPVLRDAAFRQALQYAVDRERICTTAWLGNAAPGSSFIVPYAPDSWQPSAEEAYTYDPAQANALLDAAGYAVGPDGVRLDKRGKPIVLRLYVTNDWPENQAAARFVVADLEQVGVKAKLSVMDSGGLINAMYNYKGNTYAPDWDLDIWYWGSEPDPQWLAAAFTPEQIENLNEYNWVNAEYTELCAQQAETIDPAKRKQILEEMQRIIYTSTPFMVLDYTYQLEAYNTKDWTGWVKTPNNIPGWNGAVFNYFTPATFLNVRPVTEATAAETGGSNTGLIITVVVLAALAALVIWLVRRRRVRAVEGE